MLWLSVLLLASAQAFMPHMPVLRAYTQGLKPLPPFEKADFGDRVSISGSRDETVNFVFRATGLFPKCFTPKMGTLRSKDSVLRAKVRFYEILPFVTTRPSYKKARVGEWLDPLGPAERVCARAEGGAWVLGEIAIPSEAAPGAYEGTINDSETTARLPITLKVWRMQHADRPALPLYSELTTWFLLLGHYGKWHEGEQELARKYERAMLEHRLVPMKHWLKPLAPGAGNRFDLTELVASVVKPLPDWAYATVPVPPNDAASTESWFGGLGGALKRQPWRDRSLFYLWDEPDPGAMPEVKKRAKLAHEKAPGTKVLVTTTYRPELEPYVDIFAPVVDQYDRKPFPKPELYRKPGKELWLYVSCMSHGCGSPPFIGEDSGAPDFVIDRGGAWIRSFAWVGMHYGADALLYYAVVNGYAKRGEGRDPFKDLYDFSGNGDGTLFYPGANGEPVESLRLKLWRQASFDAEYIRRMQKLEKKPAWWAEGYRALVRSGRDWERSEAPYDRFRERVGDYLDGIGSD